jgi:hypothetical protein
VVGSEQWVAETGIAVPPHRVFLQKSLGLFDSKGVDAFEKCKRVCKSIKRQELGVERRKELPVRWLGDSGRDGATMGKGSAWVYWK